MVEGEVEGVGLAAVGLGEDGDAAGFDLLGVGLGGDFEGGVGGAVVDDDDADVLVVRHQHGADGAGDDLLFVVGGDEDGDAGLVVRGGEVLAFTEAVDGGEEADDDEAAAHEDVADEEDADDEVVEEGDEEEGDGVDEGVVALAAFDGGHDFVAGFADEFGDRNDLVAVGAEGVDEDGKGGDGGRAVAAAIVHEDDGAARPGLGIEEGDLAEDAVDDLLRRLAGMLIPVVGVDLVADDDVAEALDGIDGRGLVVGVGLLIDGVGRAEVDGLNAELGGEEALGEIELEVDLALRDFGDVGMRVGVIADLVAVVVDALQEADVVLGDLADHEEGADDVVLLEDGEDLRSPLGVRAVVEADGHLFGMVAILRDGVGERIGVHRLGDDAEVGLGNGGVVVHGEGAVAVLGAAGDAQDVAIAFGVDVLSGRDLGEGLDGIGLERAVPDLPERVVFEAEALEGEGFNSERTGDAHLVEAVTASRNQTVCCCLASTSS